MIVLVRMSVVASAAGGALGSNPIALKPREPRIPGSCSPLTVPIPP